MLEGCKNKQSTHIERYKNQTENYSTEMKSLSQHFPGEQFVLKKLAHSSAVSNEFVQMGANHVWHLALSKLH